MNTVERSGFPNGRDEIARDVDTRVAVLLQSTDDCFRNEMLSNTAYNRPLVYTSIDLKL